MIEWSVAAPLIKELIEELAHTSTQKALHSPAFKARWAGKRTGFINPTAKAELILRLRSVDEVADDETRIESIDSVHTETIVGQRLITIEVRAESYRHGEETDTWAWTMAGLIRTRLRRASIHAELRVANLAIVDIGPAVDISYESNSREINAASFEVLLCGAFSDVNADTPYEWFERALVTSHIERPDGSELSEPPNYTDEPMGN